VKIISSVTRHSTNNCGKLSNLLTTMASVDVHAPFHKSNPIDLRSVAGEAPVRVAEYSPCIYQSLPGFDDIAKAFKDRKGKYFIRAVREIYLKHGVEECLGVGLVHRHFDMDSDEILVQEGMISKPYTMKEIEDSNIVPTSWTFRDNTLYPYEFEFAPSDATAFGFSQEFLTELRDLLKAFDYDTFLGITTYRKGPTLFERTEGRNNILAVVEGDPASDHTVPASWYFSRSVKSVFISNFNSLTLQ
jgi:hypothetical protein